MGGMARKSEARYTTITAPADTDIFQLNKLAAEKANSLAREGERVVMVGVLDGRPVEGQEGMMEWRVEYTVIPPAEPEPPADNRTLYWQEAGSPGRSAYCATSEGLEFWVTERLDEGCWSVAVMAADVHARPGLPAMERLPGLAEAQEVAQRWADTLG